MKIFFEKAKGQITKEEKIEALISAVSINNAPAVQFIFSETNDLYDDKFTVAFAALQLGRKKIFDEIMKDKDFQNKFSNENFGKISVKKMLSAAVKGGNVDLIKTVLDKARDQYKHSWNTSNKTNPEVAADIFIAHLCAKELKIAVASDNIGSVRLLMERTNQAFEHKDIFTPEKIKIWDAQKLDLLSLAIKNNQPNIVLLNL